MLNIIPALVRKIKIQITKDQWVHLLHMPLDGPLF